MLQPKNYPQLIGKALVLEGEPFIIMTDDDNPWVEGVFLIVVLGLLVGLAQFIGGLLLTASLPPSNAMLEALVQGWRQLWETAAPGSAMAEAAIRTQWGAFAAMVGFSGGWARLLVFIAIPAALLAHWLFYGLIGYGLARLFGGQASLNQTLGATALLVAPQVLLLFKIVPFVSVSGILIGVWSLLIVYRALQIAHELPWQKALWAAVLAPLTLLLAALTVVTAATILLAWVGG